MSDQKPNLDSLFEAAVEIESAAERAAFLDKSCGNDAELRRQVEQLLQSHEQAGSFLDKPPVGLEATTGPDAPDGNPAASLEAGLASAFGRDEAVVVGGAGHSVLKMLGQTMDVTHVALRDAAVEADDPVQRPSSPEIPRQDADSRYQLQGEIARGGMGAIIKGRDTDLGRDLAIKVLLEEHKAKPEVIQRFVEEAQIGGQLQHPGITPVYELGQFADQRPFFSMKLVKGKTLSALLEERADPSVDRMKFLGTFEQVCQTMAYAHSRGVIHRDLKPANIMVGAFGEVQVMDWGLAKVLPAGGVADEKKASARHKSETVIQTMRDVGSDTPEKFGSAGSDTQMGSIMGTPAYMPPEQALGEVDRLDERADVFGLGAILCEILTGEPPYVAADGTQVFRQARRGKLDDCFARLDACSAEPELTDLAKRALAVEPEQRPRNASAMADSITSYLVSVQERLKQAELAKAEAHARAEHATRRRKLVMAIAGLMLVIAVGAGVSAFEFRRQREAQSVLADANGALAEENETKRKEAERARQLVEIQKRNVEEEKETVQRYSEQLEREREALRQEQYFSDMLLVQQAYDDGSIGRVRELLSKYIPVAGETDRRTFEWYYWWRASHHELSAIGPRPVDIRGVSASPDQRWIAVSDWTGRLEIRDAQTLDLIANTNLGPTIPTELDIAFMDMAFMAFSRDGAILGTIDKNRVRLWDTGRLRVGDTQDLTELAAIERASRLSAIAFSPVDSSMALADLGGQITIWDPKNSKEPRSSVSCPGITKLAFSPDGSLLAALRSANPYSGADSEILIYDLAQLELRKTLKGRQRYMISLAWGGTADRSVIAIGSDVGNVCLWDGESFEDRDTLTAVGQRIQSLTFSPDGSRLAARLGEEQAVQIWETDTSGLVTTIRGHEAKVVGAGFIDQAKKLVSCGYDGSIKTWDLSQARPFLEAGSAPVSGGATAQLIVGDLDKNGDGKISKDEASAELKPHFEQIDANKDGVIDVKEAQVMSDYVNSQQAGATDQGSDDRVRWLFGRDGPVRRSVQESFSMPAFGPAEIRGFTGLSDNGQFLAVLTPDGDRTVRLEVLKKEATDSKPRPFYEKEGIQATVTPAVDIAVSDDGSRVVWASAKHLTGEQVVADYFNKQAASELVIHDVSTDTTVSTMTPFILLVALSADGNRMAALGSFLPSLWVLDISDGKIRDTDLEAGERKWLNRSRALRLETLYATDCAFSPDGQYLAVATSHNGIVIIDCESGQKVDSLKGHARAVWALSFSQDGSLLVSGGEDGTVRVWGFPSRQLRTTLRGHEMFVAGVALSGTPGDGQSIHSIDANGRILVWPTATQAEIENHAEYWKTRAEKHEHNGDAANADADWKRYFALKPNATDEASAFTAGRATAEQIVGLMDANRDGKISKDEASAELKPHFEQIDANKDGVIDVKEAQVMADYVNSQQGGSVGRVTAEQIVSYMDANRDGKISKDEASAELKPHFEQIDANKDGVIDVKEAQELVPDVANEQ